MAGGLTATREEVQWPPRLQDQAATIMEAKLVAKPLYWGLPSQVQTASSNHGVNELAVIVSYTYCRI